MVYRPDEQLTLARTLSRLLNPESNGDSKLDEIVHELEIKAEDSSQVLVGLVNFPVANRPNRLLR